MLIAPTLVSLNMAAHIVYEAKRSCHVSPFVQEILCLPLEKGIAETIFTITLKAGNGFAPSYVTGLLRDYTPVRALRSSDFRTLAMLTFKLKTVGDRSFCASDPSLWSSLPPSLCAGALVCADVTPGIVSALLRRYLLATHFDGLSPDFSSLPATSVVMLMRKCVDSHRGSVLAIKDPPR